MSENSSWLWVPQANSEAPNLLILIPCAGSSAQAYRGWRKVIPDNVELAIVQRPGRMERRDEPPPTDLFSILEPLSSAIRQRASGRPVILAGHSLGALIAYELAVGLMVENLRGLAILAMEAPSFLTGPVATSVKGMDDMEFAHYMAEHYHGMPPQLLAEPGLLRLFLPPLRADMIMFEDYRPRQNNPLTCPVVAFSGDDDLLAPASTVIAWNKMTAAAFEHHVIAGDHFFPSKNPELVMPWIQKILL